MNSDDRLDTYAARLAAILDIAGRKPPLTRASFVHGTPISTVSRCELAPHQLDPVGPEPPLGIDVNALPDMTTVDGASPPAPPPPDENVTRFTQEVQVQHGEDGLWPIFKALRDLEAADAELNQRPDPNVIELRSIVDRAAADLKATLLARLQQIPGCASAAFPNPCAEDGGPEDVSLAATVGAASPKETQ